MAHRTFAGRPPELHRRPPARPDKRARGAARLRQAQCGAGDTGTGDRRVRQGGGARSPSRLRPVDTRSLRRQPGRPHSSSPAHSGGCRRGRGGAGSGGSVPRSRAGAAAGAVPCSSGIRSDPVRLPGRGAGRHRRPAGPRPRLQPDASVPARRLGLGARRRARPADAGVLRQEQARRQPRLGEPGAQVRDLPAAVCRQPVRELSEALPAQGRGAPKGLHQVELWQRRSAAG